MATGRTTATTCNYAADGTHTITITGTYPAFSVKDWASKDQLLTVEQWGDVEWSSNSLENAFDGASNLTAVPDANSEIASATNLSNMFKGASSFNSDISGWNVEDVTNMSGMFSEAAAFNQAIGN